jgi:hypothetical protein
MTTAALFAPRPLGPSTKRTERSAPIAKYFPKNITIQRFIRNKKMPSESAGVSELWNPNLV